MHQECHDPPHEPRSPDTSIRSIDEYRTSGGLEGLKTARNRDPQATIDEITAAGLRGRGGAGFPTA